MRTPVQQFKALAKVIANPMASHPAVVTSGVWVAAKDLQGHPMTIEQMDRVGAIDADSDLGIQKIAAQMKRIRRKVRAHAKKIDCEGPAPLILPHQPVADPSSDLPRR